MAGIDLAALFPLFIAGCVLYLVIWSRDKEAIILVETNHFRDTKICRAVPEYILRQGNGFSLLQERLCRPSIFDRASDGNVYAGMRDRDSRETH